MYLTFMVLKYDFLVKDSVYYLGNAFSEKDEKRTVLSSDNDVLMSTKILCKSVTIKCIKYFFCEYNPVK